MNPRGNVIAGVILFMSYATLFGQPQKIKPVTPNPSSEAVALLEYIQSISGSHILSGQHNFPISRDRNSQFASDFIGETPVVWSQDFGFAEEGDKDSYLARPSIIDEAIRQHRLGSIITLCWHAVPPTASEPVTFQPRPGSDSTRLASVQGRLSDNQFRDILRRGTKLNKQWMKQVDEIAIYLKQLQDAKVPVLWRPYHEMNGDWFWWGGRHEGKYTTAALYRHIFDRLVNHHKLTNLIWVWSVDRPSRPDREFAKYYPGNEYLDILSIDIYGNDFDQSYYDGLMALSNGKPLVLGEVGNPPSLEILDNQPNWAYWVVWAGMVRGTSKEDYEKLAEDPGPLFMEDPAYSEGTRDYRIACGFEPLTTNRQADFTGAWVLNEYESKLQTFGPSGTPYKLDITQKNNELFIKSRSIVEWADDAITEETLTLDGRDIKSTVFNNAPRIQNARWSAEKDTLNIDSRMSFNFGGRKVDIDSKDTWTLQRKGKKLVIIRVVSSSRGTQTSTIVYYKQ
ncbi:MAG TPA: glycosyl hydrolase [Cyclobacteriaceae bacterium]